jgi:hypothetical protein
MNSFGRKRWIIFDAYRSARDDAGGWNGSISIDALQVVGRRGR